MPAAVVYGRGWKPGVIGDIVRLHAVHYWDFGVGFEARVATGLAAFIKTYDASVSRLFTASIEDGLVGSLAIAGTNDPDRSTRLHPGRGRRELSRSRQSERAVDARRRRRGDDG